MTICKNDEIINHGFLIIIQVMLTFIFLTIFFFNYVVKIEKEEFEKQIDFMVTTIIHDIKIPDDIKTHTEKYKEKILPVINNLIDINKNEEGVDINVKNTNDAIKKKANNVLFLSIGIIGFSTLVFFIIGFCINIPHHIFKSLIVVVFIALVEFLFLTFFTSNYISSDPNKVRKHVGEAINNYIKNNKNI